MTIQEFVGNVQKVLAEGLAITFLPGKLEGPNEASEWRGCCWVDRINEVPQRVDEQNIYVQVRLWAPFVAQRNARNPIDPQPLYDKADALLLTVANNQTGLGPWYQRVVQLAFDPDKQGVQAMLFAWSANPGTIVT